MPPASRGWLGLLRKWACHSSSRTLRQFVTASSDIKTAPSSIQITSSNPLAAFTNIQTASSSIQIAASTPVKVKLREYQEECIQAIQANVQKGHKRLGVSLATGAGKTVIFTQLINRILPRDETADQTLILAHRQELVEQAARHCTNAYPAKIIEIEMGSLHASGSADITVASIQSIISGDRISKFDPNRFKLILVDEAHHVVAPGYMKTLAYFGLSKAQPKSPVLVGVSATLSRFDGLRLGAAIDHIVYHKDYIDMIGEKWLSDVIFTTVQSNADISRVKKGVNGDFQPGELSQAINTDSVNEITVRTWLEKAKERKSTLVFCVDLAHVAGLTNTFRTHGIDTQFVTGDTPKPERSAHLDAFRQGKFPVLVNCGVFTEGTDIPNIDCVLLARPTKSRNLLIQMIGRGMRLYPGKKDCHIIDMVASLETGIVTTPTLFGLDPSELVEEARVDELRDMKDQKEEEDIRQQQNAPSAHMASAPVPQNITFTDYDSVFDLIADTSEDTNIRALSPYAWVCVGQDKYILPNSTGSYLRIERNFNEGAAEGFLVTDTVVLNRSISKAPFMKPRQIAKALTFADAVHAADTYAQAKYPFQFISRHQAWRNRPATDGQLNFLNKLRTKDDQLTADTLTKGKAGDMITKLKHGARGRFANIEADRRRLDRMRLKVAQGQTLKEREQVNVGPLMH